MTAAPLPPTRPLRIAVMRDRYPTRFNTPRHSRHDLRAHMFAPTHRLSPRVEAVTMFPPLFGYDLVHAYNRIPLGPTPFVIGFESHLPRYWWSSSDRLFRLYTGLLKSDGCRAIIASSTCAAQIFAAQHRDDPGVGELTQKLRVIYPNIDMPDVADALVDDDAGVLRLCFVGSHFGRKGGPVALRVAQLAREQNLPIHVTVISSLQAGGAIWTDPSRPGFFDRYLALLDAPNVTHIPGASNADVMTALARAHFSLLPTFGDTFGYSAIESMAMWTPMIATRQGALPEFIAHGENGYLLDLETSDVGEWVHSSGARDTPAFEDIYVAETERMAQASLALLEPLIGKADLIGRMRRRARETALATFDGRATGALLDTLYDEAARGPLT